MITKIKCHLSSLRPSSFFSSRSDNYSVWLPHFSQEILRLAAEGKAWKFIGNHSECWWCHCSLVVAVIVQSTCTSQFNPQLIKQPCFDSSVATILSSSLPFLPHPFMKQKKALLPCFSTQQHSVVSENLSFLPLPTFSCQPHSALRPGDPKFCFFFFPSPTAESSGLSCRMRWLALDGALKDDVCWSLQRPVTVRPLPSSQGRWTAAEDLLQRSRPEAQRAWSWLSLAPEEQTGPAVAEAVN